MIIQLADSQLGNLTITLDSADIIHFMRIQLGHILHNTAMM
jgi:hypothetical protein